MKIRHMTRDQVVAEIERAAEGIGSRHFIALLARERVLRDEEPARAERRKANAKAAGRKARRQAKARKRRAAAGR